jgi:two-component system, OmpR family, response regulator
MNEKSLKKILYIEDEADIQAIAQLALEAIGGFTVETCSSGREGIARAVAYAPDIILLDVMMPEMDGPATLVALRQLPELAGVPIVFMTAKVQPQEIEHYHALGAVDVIAKPFDPMTLAEQVRTIWSRQP